MANTVRCWPSGAGAALTAVPPSPKHGLQRAAWRWLLRRCHAALQACRGLGLRGNPCLGAKPWGVASDL